MSRVCVGIGKVEREVWAVRLPEHSAGLGAGTLMEKLMALNVMIEDE